MAHSPPYRPGAHCHSVGMHLFCISLASEPIRQRIQWRSPLRSQGERGVLHGQRLWSMGIPSRSGTAQGPYVATKRVALEATVRSTPASCCTRLRMCSVTCWSCRRFGEFRSRWMDRAITDVLFGYKARRSSGNPFLFTEGNA
jgi:hypothetical protein